MSVSRTGATAWLIVLAVVFGMMALGPAASAQTSGCGGNYPPTTGNLQISVTVVGIPGQVTVSGSGFAANATILLTLQGPAPSTASTSLGSVTADPSGNFSKTVTIGAGIQPGSYQIVASGQGINTGCRTLLSAGLTLVAGTSTQRPTPQPTATSPASPIGFRLPFTGANIVPWLVAALVLIAAGSVLLLRVRHSRRARTEA